MNVSKRSLLMLYYEAVYSHCFFKVASVQPPPLNQNQGKRLCPRFCLRGGRDCTHAVFTREEYT